MAPQLRIPSRLHTRLLAAALLVVGAWAGWVAWERFRHGGASFNSGVVQSFLEARFTALSDGVYHVRLGAVDFDLASGSANVDSAVITTDTVRNALRAHPLPVVNVVLRDAQVRGVVRDADGLGLAIEEIRFGHADADLTFAPPVVDTSEAVAALPAAIPPIVSWTFELPAGAPQVRIARIIMEGVTAEVRPAPGAAGMVQRVEHLTLMLDSVRLDRRAEGIHLPFVVHDIRLSVLDFTGGWDSVSTITAGRLQGSFRDSTLMGIALGMTPSRSIAEVLRRGHRRRERVTLQVDSIRARGVDWSSVIREGAVPLRSVMVDGADLLLYTDQRLPPSPTPRPRTPLLQETLAHFGRRVAIDTILLRHGRIRYRVRAAEGEGIGEVDFDQLEARLTGFRWHPGSRSAAEARLVLHARLWGAAPMALTIHGPIGSPTPRADVELTVGAMPITAANAIVPAIDAFNIKSGVLDSALVFVSVTGDHATGEVRPFYRDLAVRGRSQGNFFARLARGASEVIANSFVVRDDNPGRGGEVMVGTIDHTRDPWQTFWPFVWASTREALAQVGKGKGTATRP